MDEINLYEPETPAGRRTKRTVVVIAAAVVVAAGGGAIAMAAGSSSTGHPTGATPAAFTGGQQPGAAQPPATGESGSAAPSPAPTTSPSAGVGGTGRGPGPGGFGAFGAGVVHGTFVVKSGSGYVTEDVRSGTVTALTATLITVQSSDGTTGTFAIDSATKKASTVKSGATVLVIATAGTATAVLDPAAGRGFGGGGGFRPGHSGTGTRPSSFPTGTRPSGAPGGWGGPGYGGGATYGGGSAT